VIGELAGDARVLAGDEIGGGQNFERPQGHVAQVADRSCHQIEPGRERGRRDGLPGEQVGARAALAARSRRRGVGGGHAFYLNEAVAGRHRPAVA
jgi:hypothetical protein